MQNSPVQLGPINLEDFEIPESVRFGGRQRLAIHALSSGKRVVERLGRDDSEIQFSGTFSGPNAEARARAIDSLRMSGEIVWLTWESFRRQIVVKSFIADYHNPWWIAYQISCVVVRQAEMSSPTATIASLILADLNSALTASPGIPLSLAGLQRGILSGNALTNGTADQVNALTLIGSTLGAISDQINQQSDQIAIPIAADNTPADLATAYNSRVQCAATLVAMATVRSYVGRVRVNLGRSGA